MKHICSTLSMVAMFAFSCTKLEEKPESFYNPGEFYKSIADVQITINGSYGYMASEPYWGRQLPSALLLLGDMCEIGDLTTPKARVDINNFVASSDNGMIVNVVSGGAGGFWPRSYTIIASANQAINAAKQINADDQDQTKNNPTIAQAYFVRAFTYYHLVRLFGAVPYIDANLDVDAIKTLSRTPEKEVYANIIADLNFAKKWLPNKTATRELPSKATAQAYLASVYLTLASPYYNGTGVYTSTTCTDVNDCNTKAYNEANDIISKASTYDLTLTADYQDLFDATKQMALKEPLFQIGFKGNVSATDGGLDVDWMGAMTGCRGNLYKPANGAGWSVLVPSLKVFTSWDEKDYRRRVSFDTTIIGKTGAIVPYTNFKSESTQAVNRPHIAKYYRFPGTTGINAGNTSIKYATMRYAEVLLIAAEVANNIGKSAEAETWLNQVRKRAREGYGSASTFPANYNSSLDGTLQAAIINERRLELAFEFKRWYDIKRLKIGPTVFNVNGLEPHSNFDETKHYLLPIPATEILRNPNLAPNNPGY